MLYIGLILTTLVAISFSAVIFSKYKREVLLRKELEQAYFRADSIVNEVRRLNKSIVQRAVGVVDIKIK